MAKTYVPGAVQIVGKAHKYLSRYQPVLTAGASTEKVTAFAELLACCAKFLAVWFKPDPLP